MFLSSKPTLMLGALVATFATFSPELAQGKPPKTYKDNPLELSEKFRQAAKFIQPSLVYIDAKCERADCAPKKGLVEHSSDQKEDSNPAVQPGENDSGFEPVCKGRCSGTGIILDTKGHILTCNHVIGHAQSVVVILPNGKQFSAREVRSDPLSDLAVLYVPEAVDLIPAKLGDSALLEIGDFVVSVGHPYGLSDSISAGIVSALNREIAEAPRAPLIQSDAASNPGSSGGALLDIDGHVVGICQGSYGNTSGFAGISFAVPSNVARNVTDQLIRFGAVRRAYLGCRFEPVTVDIAAAIGMREVAGVIVTSVADESPASEKIKPGDVILAFDGRQIAEVDTLRQMIETADTTRFRELLIYREGETLSKKIKLEPVTASSPRSLIIPHYKVTGASIVDEEMGVQLVLLSPEELDKFGYGPKAVGLFISRVFPNTPTSRAGIGAGTLVNSIDGKPVRTLHDYKSATKNIKNDASFLVLIDSPAGSRHVVVKQHK